MSVFCHFTQDFNKQNTLIERLTYISQNQAVAFAQNNIRYYLNNIRHYLNNIGLYFKHMAYRKKAIRFKYSITCF